MSKLSKHFLEEKLAPWEVYLSNFFGLPLLLLPLRVDERLKDNYDERLQGLPLFLNGIAKAFC